MKEQEDNRTEQEDEELVYSKLAEEQGEQKLKTLLEELEETKHLRRRISQNHLLDTIIKRVEELILNKFETETRIGF